MKKIILIALLSPLFCVAQKDLQTAIVTKHNNIPVFVMSEPVKEYNVVGAVTNKFRTDTTQTAKAPITINDMVDNLVNYAQELAKKDKIDFDAIITTDGLSGSLIKFKPKSITDSVVVKP
jgi:endoglucanase Acf2